MRELQKNPNRPHSVPVRESELTWYAAKEKLQKSTAVITLSLLSLQVFRRVLC